MPEVGLGYPTRSVLWKVGAVEDAMEAVAGCGARRHERSLIGRTSGRLIMGDLSDGRLGGCHALAKASGKIYP